MVLFLILSSKTAHVEIGKTNYNDDALIAPQIILGSKGQIKTYAKDKVVETWGYGEWIYFDDLVMRESGWINTAQNPISTAYGLCQFLDQTWSGVGYTKTSNPIEQIDSCIKYIEKRYSTPNESIQFHNLNGWF